MDRETQLLVGAVALLLLLAGACLAVGLTKSKRQKTRRANQKAEFTALLESAETAVERGDAGNDSAFGLYDAHFELYKAGIAWWPSPDEDKALADRARFIKDRRKKIKDLNTKVAELRPLLAKIGEHDSASDKHAAMIALIKAMEFPVNYQLSEVCVAVLKGLGYTPFEFRDFVTTITWDWFNELREGCNDRDVFLTLFALIKQIECINYEAPGHTRCDLYPFKNSQVSRDLVPKWNDLVALFVDNKVTAGDFIWPWRVTSGQPWVTDHMIPEPLEVHRYATAANERGDLTHTTMARVLVVSRELFLTLSYSLGAKESRMRNP